MAQSIPLIGSLLLARLFTPTQFGVFAAWLGLVAVLAVMVTGRYETALAIEHDGEPRRIGVWAILGCIVLAGVVLVMVTLALVMWQPPWSQRVPLALRWALVPTACLVAASQVWQSWAAAEGRYADLTRMRITQAAGITGLQLALGLWWPQAESLGLAHGAGALLGLLAGARWMPVGARVSRNAAWAFLRQHHRFPMLSLPADAINTAAGQLPLIMVASRFGADVAGLLALTLRTLAAPIGLLGAAVLDVFKRRASAAFRERGECRAEYVQTFKVLGLGSLGVAVLIGFFSEPLFALAFGERWRAAGTLALWLMPLFALRFVASPLSYMMYVAQKQHADLIWQVGVLGVTLASFALPAQHDLALQTYSAGYSAMYVIYLFMSYRFSLGKRT